MRLRTLAGGVLAMLALGTAWSLRHPIRGWTAPGRGTWCPVLTGIPRMRVLVEGPADPDVLETSRSLVREAERRLEAWLGPPESRPLILLCQTPERFRSATGLEPCEGVTLRNPFQPVIAVAPHGLRAEILAHEWGHAELDHRLGWWRTEYRLPAWFNEGLCLLMSGDPRFTPETLEPERKRLGWRPGLGELTRPGSFLAAAQRSVPLAYGQARWATEGWIRAKGPGAPLALIRAMAEGASFESAFGPIPPQKDAP